MTNIVPSCSNVLAGEFCYTTRDDDNTEIAFMANRYSKNTIISFNEIVNSSIRKISGQMTIDLEKSLNDEVGKCVNESKQYIIRKNGSVHGECR
jgi:hypothetical protein